jgi:hypothetical protein
MKKIFFIGLLILTLACNLPTPQVESVPPTSLPTSTAVATPTQTLTPAPTFTPTATASPTRVPLYFTEEFNTNLGAWKSFQTGGAQSPLINMQDGLLQINFPAPNTWYYAIHTAHEYPNVFVSARFSGAPSGAIGVVCYYSEEHGWYEFNLTHEGSYNVLFGEWLAEGIAQYKSVFDGSSEYLQVGNLNYEIGLTCTNNTLSLHVNGKLFRKIDVKRYGLTTGMVGISAASFDNVPMNATFEWFKVGKPE